MIEKKYNHCEVEKDKYNKWLEKGSFRSGALSKEPFSIVIPPPNVTGKLHLGHAWNTTIQDVIIRYKKLEGYDTLWLPGMDHAGIATQAKVDERLKKEGISPRDMKRDEWLKRAWSWKEEYAGIIRGQWAKLGLSLDYSKEKFTMEASLNEAVNEVFVKLYNKGLIYKGERIINFDPEAMTALSNIEVIYKEEEAFLYHLKYKLEDSDEFLEVATTRPETIFGDTALAVNPNDQRYNALAGKLVTIPTLSKKIPIVLDDYADMEFGTGVVKITPAHDPNDFEVGNRHDLERIICMNLNGTMNENANIYNGLDRFECRKQLLEELEKNNLLVKKEKIVHSVGYSERTDVIIEPYLSKQWFVKMEKIAERSIKNQEDESLKVNFVPKRFETIFLNWMSNIQDWCISRQLWWGHRIPAWYKDDEIYVGLKAPTGDGWVQDKDVLDTWFSSALWPFATLGWPNEFDKRYFPNDVLVTGYDIIFFWVSRMIFQSLEFTDERPFKEVLIHGLIRDKDGRKMSKSLGNGVDPMDIIDQYGADSLRFFLATTSAPGQDLRYDEEKIKSTWNFINKLWNASRFVVINTEGFNKEEKIIDNLSIYDKWIITRLNETVKEVKKAMSKYEFNVAGSSLYSFIWNDFCDWYIEFAKNSLEKESTKGALVKVLISILKMLHPFMPYVTEEIYQTIINDGTSIMDSEYPIYDKVDSCKMSVEHVNKVQEIITKIRIAKQEHNIGKEYYIVNNLNELESSLLEDNAELISKILRAEIINEITDDIKKCYVTFPYGTLIIGYKSEEDEGVNKDILIKEKEMLLSSVARRTKLLSNEGYIKKAPPSIVEEEKRKIEEEKDKIKILEEKINSAL